MQRVLGWLEDRRTLGLVFLLLWAIYFTVIAFGNLVELLWSFGWLDWQNRSGNLKWVGVSVEIFVDERWINQVLLFGAIAWEATAAVLLWRALVKWGKKATTAPAAARGALLFGTVLWFLYAIITEVTVSYARGNNESDYWVICGSSLATILILALVARDGDTETA